MEKRTLVLGASLNPDRYSFKAIKSLQKLNIPFVAIGRRDEKTDDFQILSGKPENIGHIHTVTLYINSYNQKGFYNYILSLTPERIIFNPGTMNPEFSVLASKAGIEVVEACTLVMLCTGVY
jgi:predicted CoA-binding protein